MSEDQINVIVCCQLRVVDVHSNACFLCSAPRTTLAGSSQHNQWQQFVFVCLCLAHMAEFTLAALPETLEQSIITLCGRDEG